MRKDICCLLCSQSYLSMPALHESLEDLAANGRKLCYRAGQTVFYEGHLPLGAYVLRQGRLALQHPVFKETFLRTVGPADGPFGLFHLITATPYCATAVAATNVDLTFISKVEVLPLLAVAAPTGLTGGVYYVT